MESLLNSEVINIAVNAGMLLVWIVYAQLFYFSWKRGRMPVMVISATTTRDLDAECMICNMAQQVCFVEAIALSIEYKNDEEQMIFLNDVQGRLGKNENAGHLDEKTLQGPLKSGEEVNLGAFRELIRRADSTSESDYERLKGLEVRVIGYYGVERRPFGAMRAFSKKNGSEGITPKQTTTDHLSARSERQQVNEWLEQFYQMRENEKSSKS